MFLVLTMATIMQYPMKVNASDNDVFPDYENVLIFQHDFAMDSIFDSDNDGLTPFATGSIPEPIYSSSHVWKVTTNASSYNSTFIIPYDFGVATTLNDSAVGSASASGTEHLIFQSPALSFKGSGVLQDYLYHSLTVSGFVPNISVTFRKYNTFVSYPINPSVKNIKVTLHVVMNGEEYTFSPSKDTSSTPFVFSDSIGNIVSIYYTVEMDLDYVITLANGWAAPPAGFFVDLAMTIPSYVFNSYGVNVVESGYVYIGNLITNFIDSVNSQFISLKNELNANFKDTINHIDAFATSQHNDIVNLDSHLVSWSSTINNSIVNWSQTLFNRLTSFYDRNHVDLVQIHTDLTQYDSTAGGMDGANDQFKFEMDSYKQNTDTSVQYSKINDDIFELDTNFFTSLASTATFFSSLVTMAFNSLGDFDVALTIFLVLMFVSMVLGIASKVKGGD